MESSFAALVLDDEDGDDLDLKTVAVEVQPDTNQLVVVGCVLTDKIVNFGTTRNTLSNLLRSGNGVLDGSPWTFNNHLILFHQLQPGDDPFTIQFIHALF
uniref:Uncharacterized protein n=1 Tax=Manihot esculenta TaxID=3983 RepID=A0A2C9U895_MANES